MTPFQGVVKYIFNSLKSKPENGFNKAETRSYVIWNGLYNKVVLESNYGVDWAGSG